MLLPRIVVLAILVMMVLINNQDFLLHLTVGDFELIATDGVRQSAAYTFDHYNNDVIRAIEWMKKNAPLCDLYKSVKVSRVLYHPISGYHEYTPFVKASMTYLRACEPKTRITVGIVINMRHRLSDTNAPGNYLRIQTCQFEPDKNDEVNAKEMKRCISHAKQKEGRSSGISLIMDVLKCNIIINSWGVKDTNWFITPGIKEEFCSSVVYDGRRRFVVLSNVHETWYVRYEQYL